MFDLGWSEMAVIMLVAIIVIGPKDLPRVARSVGKWTGKARALARDFQRSLDDMAREAELDEIKKTVEKASPGRLRNTVTSAIEDSFDLDDRKSAGKERRPTAAPSADKAGTSPLTEGAAGQTPGTDRRGSSGDAATTDG
ncbi:MAG: Sec-independent protein translocase protein TatB [Geminicoccaceae bacterium]